MNRLFTPSNGFLLLLIMALFTTYPPKIGSGQILEEFTSPDTFRSKYDRIESTQYRAAEIAYEIKRLIEKKEAEEKALRKELKEKPRVIVKPKVKTVPLDSAAVWLRHPDGSVQRIVFSTSQVPIINLVSDTIADTVKLKRRWVLFGPYREF